MDNPYWGLFFHFAFLTSCVGVLVLGVRNGIERCNKIMMPTLFLVLGTLAIHGLFQPNASEGLAFLLKPDWKALSAGSILVALGQAFFTLSLGQGTMVTYGSYLGTRENILRSCVPVVLMDTLVSILSAVAVFTIVFSAGLKPDSGPGLIFHTLPWVFSQIPGGHLVAILFFLLVVLAALTSEISAMEPTIAYLMDEKKWPRTKAVLVCGLGAFLLGVPAALSTSVLKNWTFHGMTWLDGMDFLATSILIPLGALAAVLLVGYRWGVVNALKEMGEGAGRKFQSYPLISRYFWFCFKYAAPLLIIFVFLNGIFSSN
jgi:NSS family neurotransmitter:Na+ symporter